MSGECDELAHSRNDVWREMKRVRRGSADFTQNPLIKILNAETALASLPHFLAMSALDRVSQLASQVSSKVTKASLLVKYDSDVVVCSGQFAQFLLRDAADAVCAS